jgi:hypothetical protein
MLDNNDQIDHQRWLIDNGFINDLHKDNLFAYGTLVHKEIQAVEARIDITSKVVDYDLYITSRLSNRLLRFEELSKSNSIMGLWLFKRMLHKEGNLDFSQIINNFVKSYLGSKWSATINLKDIREYEEGFKQESGVDAPSDKPANL